MEQFKKLGSERLIRRNISAMNRMINEPLTESDILYFAQPLPHFRGVFMRNDLPKRPGCLKNECGVINLDDWKGSGTHWVSYCRKNENCYYFDSFGNLQPPKEFVQYVGDKCKIHYNYNSFQKFGTVNCGHLCLKFLYKMYDILKTGR